MTIGELREKLAAFSDDDVVLIPGGGENNDAFIHFVEVRKVPMWKSSRHSYTLNDIGPEEDCPDGHFVIFGS